LVAVGHDALRVDEQGLNGMADPQVAAACVAEGRAIVTLDMDCSDIRTYPPDQFAGIIVFRPSSQMIPVLERLTDLVIGLLSQETLTGCLWIVEDARVRVRTGVSP
jgi:hypothetical protein